VLDRLRAVGPVAIGVATEVFAQEEWPALVARAVAWSRAAVELTTLTLGDLDTAAALLRVASPPARYVSVHAPIALADGDEGRLVSVLTEVGSRVAAVIQHPDIVDAPARLAPLGQRLVLENMDARKQNARDVPELESYFRALPDAGFCLDVAHVRTIDSEMKLAHELLDSFGTRLRELHISGIDDKCNHVPLDHETVDSFAEILHRCRGVPWILESLPVDAR
jgi:sugar phosphate isomerase/epimerase